MEDTTPDPETTTPDPETTTPKVEVECPSGFVYNKLMHVCDDEDEVMRSYEVLKLFYFKILSDLLKQQL